MTGLAVGAAAAASSSYYPYGYGDGAYYGGSCVANQPVYDAWGNFAGYQRVYVSCY
ncbi:hypothetical protein LMG27198_37100 [Methylocystis echinoides]|uniref:Uncharacterized protein n=1 Tax=Methylocystis echinoides TaxID=29468 RepID=A0A9W6LTK1_9HYPH|nr:hypothetical protein LMG27198_37100 [Methylocystis echinoides]